MKFYCVNLVQFISILLYMNLYTISTINLKSFYISQLLKLQIEIEHFDTNNLIAHGRDNRRLV